jgi:hypothetical protein
MSINGAPIASTAEPPSAPNAAEDWTAILSATGSLNRSRCNLTPGSRGRKGVGTLSLRYGKKGEDTWTSDLAEELRKQGLGATAFPMFHIHEGGHRTLSKPDIEITNGGVSVGSAKIGENALIKALSTAQEYNVKLQRAEELRTAGLREVFAITYPAAKGERFHLIVLPRPWRTRTLTYAVDGLRELAESIVGVVRGQEAKLKEIPLSEEAPRLLYFGARELADTIKGVRQEELEEVFGGHDFFQAVLATKLVGKERGETLRLGAAFLFVNQIFFYVLLSREGQEHGKGGDFPPIAEDDMGNPEKLNGVYFKKVHDKNYEPIYGTIVAPFFKGPKAQEACADVVRSIVALAPGIGKRDLAGQVFQTLIPASIRKPLGAHYTNPRAAELLAGLSIDRYDARVIDPACGSGTLLVAAYHRKMLIGISQGRKPEVLHKAFVEREVTGLDAMAFAAHLAAVNLALQQPLTETEHVRIATTDSTLLRPNTSLERVETSLPTGLRDARLDHDFSTPRRKKARGPIQMKKGTPQGFVVGKVDTVIMNPPFTRWSTMNPDYRDGMRKRFADESPEFSKLLVKRPGQHLFFLLLAHLFLERGGKIAAVIPQSTFHEAAYQQWVRFLVENYSVHYIVVGLARASFSEQSALSECLVVAAKGVPKAGHKFTLIGALKPPEAWSAQETEDLLDRVQRGSEGPKDFAKIRQFEQSELLPEGQTLPTMYLRLIGEFDAGVTALDQVQKGATPRLISIQDAMGSGGLEIVRGIETAEHFSFYGPKALLICRSAEGAGQVDRLMIDDEGQRAVTARDRMTGKTYKVPAANLRPALRSISDFSQMDVTAKTDLSIVGNPEVLEEIFRDIYGRKEAQRFLARVRLKNKWTNRVGESSSRLLLFRRGNLSASGTRLISFWSREPVLQAGVNYAVKGAVDETTEKLLCLWFNSTPFIIRLLGQASVTEGAFVTLEGFGLARLPIPQTKTISPRERAAIADAFARLGQVKFPSLLEQLATHHPSRVELDEAVLHLLGVSASNERERLAQSMREGAAAAIHRLMATMGGGE